MDFADLPSFQWRLNNLNSVIPQTLDYITQRCLVIVVASSNKCGVRRVLLFQTQHKRTQGTVLVSEKVSHEHTVERGRTGNVFSADGPFDPTPAERRPV